MQGYHKHSTMIHNFSIKSNSCLFVLNVKYMKEMLGFLKKERNLQSRNLSQFLNCDLNVTDLSIFMSVNEKLLFDSRFGLEML